MDDRELGRQLEQHHRESVGWALSCCQRDRSRAEDVLQRVYLKVLEGKARFKVAALDSMHGSAAFKTWLFAVIRTTARDERRKELLRQVGLLKYQQRRTVPTPATVVDSAMEQHQLREAFAGALAKLPERQRQSLQLVFYHEMTLADAAKVMGVSLGSARTHYERAKKRLRADLGRKGLQ